MLLKTDASVHLAGNRFKYSNIYNLMLNVSGGTIRLYTGGGHKNDWIQVVMLLEFHRLVIWMVVVRQMYIQELQDLINTITDSIMV